MIKTPITDLFGIRHPVLLAGMGTVAGPELAAAVTNAGGLGTIGGIMMSPQLLRKNINMLKEELNDKNAPFGVDLLFPQVGAGARKTNYDYTHGQTSELVDVIIEGGAKLFVCAVGVPPKFVVDKLHAAGIPVMNMIGAVKHVDKALAVGVDIICAQGSEAGGHTGDIATSILIPKVVDACRGKISPLTGKQVTVVAAGGIFDGRGLAAALSVGAGAVWVGTRFVASEEANAGPYFKGLITKAGYNDMTRTLIYSGRPLRCAATPFVKDWEENHQLEIKETLAKGKLPVGFDGAETYKDRCYPMGQASGAIDEVKPAGAIVEEMVDQAYALISSASAFLAPSPPAARL